ncbi:hypothetical protein RvY_01494 [Ramazzottius varieornatus]|uniref:Fork-head domain-containing protein n=1 Tax=Ramazzottius varieornatus TaxID=947166 RepID=A0A1D1UGV8_RAMVA|nr:hypothetical protein RvY_01494 [Ramazzottius varieornatus]
MENVTVYGAAEDSASAVHRAAEADQSMMEDDHPGSNRTDSPSNSSINPDVVGREGGGPNQKPSVKSNYQRRPKPPFSYIALIAKAIRASATGKLTLAEINDYLMKEWPFFRGDYTGWRNSIRHNLSLNECFKKVLRDPNRPWGKDNYWMLNESSDYTFADGVFRRRRKRLHKKCRSGGRATGGGRLVNEFNPEHKHENFRNRRQSSFLIDDLLGRRQQCSTSEEDRLEGAAVGLDENIPSRSSITSRTTKLPPSVQSDDTAEEVCGSRCSQVEASSKRKSVSATAAASANNKTRKLLDNSVSTAVKKSNSSHRHHSAIGHQLKLVPHSSSPSRSPSVSLNKHVTASVSTNAKQAKKEAALPKPDDIIKPKFLRYSSAKWEEGEVQPLSAYPFWLNGACLPRHHPHSLMAMQPYAGFPFSANTFPANLYPFLSSQALTQMAAGCLPGPDAAQLQSAVCSIPNFSSYMLKPFT